EALQRRIAGLTDEELLEMVTVEAGEYRQEAIDFAKAELTSRGIDFTRRADKKDTVQGESPAPLASDRPASDAVCEGCGGLVRSGTLVTERELTVVSDDNHEERCVKASACTRCGYVALIADFRTDVAP